MPLQGIGQWVESKVFVFTKGRFHQRAEGLDEQHAAAAAHCRIRPCIET
jgi:hypothetical protein